VPGTLLLPSTLFDKTAWWFERVNAFLRESLPCTQGCSGCCVGLFPVTILDRQEIQLVSEGFQMSSGKGSNGQQQSKSLR